MPNLMPQFRTSSVLLDSSKGINKFKLSDFVLVHHSRGTSVVVQNDDGSYSFKSKGGTSSVGTDAVYALSKDKIWEGTLILEVEFHNVTKDAQQCYGEYGKRIIYKSIKLSDGSRWLMLLSNKNLQQCFSIGLNSLGPACELKILRAWQLDCDIPVNV